MVLRKPLVSISGFTSELPPGDTIEGVVLSATLTAGSGLLGGGSLSSNQRIDVGLASNPSGLILVGNNLGLDGVAQRTSDTALASGNAALSSAATAQASGNAALSSAATALASGNAALTSASLKLPLTGGILTGNLTLDDQSDLRFREATAGGTNYVGFQAPSSVSSDVLWTLPGSDGSSGQVLQTNGTGTLSFATPGGGKILQVLQTVDQGSYWNTTSTSYVATSLFRAITPSSTSSNILILVTLSNMSSASNQAMYFTLYRNSTNLATGASASFSYPPGAYGTESSAITFLDSPSTTSSVTYAIYAKVSGGVGYLGNSGNTSTIQVLEVGP